MSRFVVRRIVEILVVLAVMSLVIYALIGLMPGDPVDLMIASNPHLTVADAARLKALYGLDKPLLERYAAWLGAALHGDFGYSRLYARSTLAVLIPRLGNTALLMGMSFALTLALAWPLGLLAARRPGSWFDGVANLSSFATISVPSFWLALMLILVFAVQLGWLPPGGAATIGAGGVADRADHLVLPVITLTLVNFGPQLRYMRAAMMETLHQDYIRTARAKGAGEARILTRHALRNALIPLITVVALSFGSLFSGALVTETMFAYPGMGKLIYDAVLGNDYNLALAGLLFATLMTLLANFAADLAYAAADPRIAYR
ncbi:MAG: ABC transporter permease [Alphaproteobacteria bacterium]|nr:ABC transporter permease [Alphaproteobacteria bacterium]